MNIIDAYTLQEKIINISENALEEILIKHFPNEQEYFSNANMEIRNVKVIEGQLYAHIRAFNDEIRYFSIPLEAFI